MTATRKSSQNPLRILAGSVARAQLRERGLRLDDVGALVAAAGGTKFLLLAGLDRALFPALRERQTPLHCVGASIGAWRIACLASDDPTGGIARLADAYIEERTYSARKLRDYGPIAEAFLDAAIGGTDPARIVEHSSIALHILASRCGGLVSKSHPALLLAGLGFAAASNLVSRRALGLQLSRVIFERDRGPIGDLPSLRTTRAHLDAGSLRTALLASAAVPLLVKGVVVDGKVHRDAGIVDYHPVVRVRPDAGLILYPHFYPHLSPGWFDRSLVRRRAHADLERVVLLAPSESFVESLPGGKRPSRSDARRHSDAERTRRWRMILERSNELGDAFRELISSKSIDAEPL